MPRLLILSCLAFCGCIGDFPAQSALTEEAGSPEGGFADQAAPDASSPGDTQISPDEGRPPPAEICDGLDQDGDGTADEAVPLMDCPLQQGVCQGSRQPCTMGAYQPCQYLEARPAFVAEEGPGFCDGADNDCDGAVDEGCACEPGEDQICGEVVEVGECRLGRQLCQEGIFGPCQGVVEPKPESCDRRDEDCDGRTDEEGPCDTRYVGPCAQGRLDCGGPRPCALVPRMVEEQLDGRDDDCDGLVDEGLPPMIQTLDLADLAVGGPGRLPGLPPQVPALEELPIVVPGVMVDPLFDFVAGVFVPLNGNTSIGGDYTYRFGEEDEPEPQPDSQGLYAKGPGELMPSPAEVLELMEYNDPVNHSVLEMPASFGISFDLAMINAVAGRPANRLTVRLGSLSEQSVTFLVIEDGDRVILNTLTGPQEQPPRDRPALEIPLLPGSRLLTLVTINGEPGGVRQAYFGDPTLHFPDLP